MPAACGAQEVRLEGYFRYLERASGLDAQSPGSSSDVLEYLKYSDKFFLKDSDNSRHFTPGLTSLFFRTYISPKTDGLFFGASFKRTEEPEASSSI